MPKILIADDNLAIREMIVTRLQLKDYNVTEAENGQSAYLKIVDAAKEKQPFDLVITDGQMPEMNGEELTRALRNHPNRLVNTIIIILFSGNIVFRAETAIAAGVNAMVDKGDNINILLKKIKELLYE